jgi:hypothetical protein
MTVVNAPKTIMRNKVCALYFHSHCKTTSLLGTPTNSGAVSSSRVRITKMLERKIPQLIQRASISVSGVYRHSLSEQMCLRLKRNSQTGIIYGARMLPKLVSIL